MLEKKTADDFINSSRPYPKLLYFCDFPPSNLRGGSVLITRLLADYPQDKVVILTGMSYLRISPQEGRLKCNQIIFPTTDASGRWGRGAIKSALNWLSIPILALFGMGQVKRRNVEAIVTIAHGYFFLAAALTSLFTSVPLILIVHDDWVGGVRKSRLPKCFYTFIFRVTGRIAQRVYAVSPFMQEYLKSDYNIDSTLQMSAIELCPVLEPDKRDDHSAPVIQRNQLGCVRVLYAGMTTSAMDDSLAMLIQLIKDDKLQRRFSLSCELDLYTPATSEEIKALGWEHEHIRVHGWVSQSELHDTLRTADILFLPFSFREEEKYATTRAFPTKTADYLGARRPILIFAPSDSSIVRYARQFGFAEIVDEPSLEALAQGIQHISSSREYQERLVTNATAICEKNHSIAKQRAEFVETIQFLARKGSPILETHVTD
ncbi:MAG: glycosyltransferase [Abitibacteriaceae bacterium]|nr:glycosyltransferase [Abditibacteriaceae bacterium]